MSDCVGNTKRGRPSHMGRPAPKDRTLSFLSISHSFLLSLAGPPLLCLSHVHTTLCSPPMLYCPCVRALQWWIVKYMNSSTVLKLSTSTSNLHLIVLFSSHFCSSNALQTLILFHIYLTTLTLKGPEFHSY